MRHAYNTTLYTFARCASRCAEIIIQLNSCYHYTHFSIPLDCCSHSRSPLVYSLPTSLAPWSDGITAITWQSGCHLRLNVLAHRQFDNSKLNGQISLPFHLRPQRALNSSPFSFYFGRPHTWLCVRIVRGLSSRVYPCRWNLSSYPNQLPPFIASYTHFLLFSFLSSSFVRLPLSHRHCRCLCLGPIVKLLFRNFLKYIPCQCKSKIIYRQLMNTYTQ